MLANYDDETPFRMRSTYVEGGSPYYVGHARFGGGTPGAASNHVVIARLNEPSMNADDFRFWIVRGLADTNDASLMSFELASIPGSYARFDSMTPTRWPMCNDAATYGWANCLHEGLAMVEQRHHMLWVDPLVDDATYRSDATFERRESRNGNSTMASFAWHQDDTLYLRHVSYQLLGRTVGSPAQNNDASFTLEQ